MDAAPSISPSACMCAGLMNLGNTCFLNSVLQCLTYTAPFANYVNNSRHKASCRVTGFCAMCALEDHMKEVFSAWGKTVSPSYLVNNLSHISSSFVWGQQQDAHEYLYFLIEGLQKSCASCVPTKTPFTSAENSFVSDIFIGQLRSQVQCNSCLHSSYSAEAFLGLSLEVEHCNSVLEALSRFTAVEILEENSKSFCTHCKNLANRSKQLMFEKSPQVLALHLKRFKASALLPTKIEKSIDYDLSLDLLPYISKRDELPVQESERKYSLYAVLVHSGPSTASGHYFCFVHTSPGTWHCMNDTLVSEVSKKIVLEQQAYILFYIREGMEALSGLEINAFKSCTELLHVSAIDSCATPSLFEASQTKTDCNTGFTTSFNLNLSTLVEVNDVTRLSRAEVTPSETKSTLVSDQIDLDDMLEMLPDKQAANRPSLIKRVSSAQESSQHNDKQKSGKRYQSTNVHGASSSKHDIVKTKRSQNLVALNGEVGAVAHPFLSGSQHSYMRLLSAMPAGRRRAFASAFPAQDPKKQNNLADTFKVPNDTRLLQDGEPPNMVEKQRFLKRNSSDKKIELSTENPWTEDYTRLGSWKLQRVGGKRVVASLVES